MRKVLSVFLMVAMLLTLIPAVGAEEVIGISTAEQLQAVSEDLGGSYVLLNDITLTEGFSPIGSEDAPFDGVLDGAGFTVYGLDVAVESNGTVLAGLIACNEGTVTNLTLMDASVAGDGTDLYATTYTDVGGIAAINSGVIENCAVFGTVSGGSAELTAYVGGLVGENRGTVAKSAACVSLEAVGLSEAVAGGIAGWNKGVIEDCFNARAVTATAAAEDTLCRAGGIAGKNGFAGNGIIARCHNLGAVSAVDGEGYAGGISGNNLKTVEDCYYLETAASAQIGTAAETTGALSAERYAEQASFEGLDFETVWVMERYPVLKGLAAVDPFGDFNANGWLDTGDVTVLLRYCNRDGDVSVSLAEGDLNGDGSITLADALRLLKKING